jgi:DNA helicase HerA-like ATPase
MGMAKLSTLEQEESTNESLLPEIRLEDRIAIFGGTGSGKSILAQVLFRSLPQMWHKIIIDITDSIIEPTALTFYDPENIPWDKAWNLRYVPDINVDLEPQVNALYISAFYHGACWIWLDEANEVTSAHHTAFGLRKVLLQGRKAYVGHASVTPRPADISKSIVTQAQYIITFTLVDFDDRIRVARYIGMTTDEFDQAIGSLGEYEYLFYDVAYRNLYRVPAVPVEIVDAILNSPEQKEVEIAHPETPLV